jgi:hypothetical protein
MEKLPTNTDSVKLSDLWIGAEFKFHEAGDTNRVTDIGTRSAAFITLDKDDPSWYNGPPYAITEHVLDEYSLEGITLTNTKPGGQ